MVASLPARQRVADALTDRGLAALGLPTTYPLDASGGDVPRTSCQLVGGAVHANHLRGVYCRSAAIRDGSGRELAWYPARPTSRARAAGKPLPFDAWWPATDLDALLAREGARPSAERFW